MKIDLNSDLGEGADVDDSLLDLVTSANIACGGHTGDDQSMRTAVVASVERGVRIGAHPSYPDRENFGRVSIGLSPSDIRTSITEQIARLVKIAHREGAQVAYIKPHGALYNDAGKDAVAETLLEVARRFRLPLMVLAGSPLESTEVPTIREGFIDRAYAPEGTLRPRSEQGAFIDDPRVAAAQALTLAPRVDSLCVHSDTPRALQLLQAARAALEEGGYEISAE